MEKNLTIGSVFKNVILFSLPYLLSYFLQTLYGMADLFIIGQFEGVASTTAVSIGSQVMHMLTVMIVGLAMGTTNSIGQAIGAGDRKQVANNVVMCRNAFMAVSIALMAVLLVLVHPIISAMSTPTEAVKGGVGLTRPSALSASHLSQRITLSVLFSVVWATARKSDVLYRRCLCC